MYVRQFQVGLGRCVLTLLVLLAVLWHVPGAARAEPAPLPARMQPVQVDSGPLLNPGPAPTVVFSQTLDLGADVPWVRVLFDKETTLSPGSFIRVTSLLDGETQILDAEELENWSYGTAFFNGSGVKVELVGGPQVVPSRVRIAEVVGGDVSDALEADDSWGGVADICGRMDSRVQSYDRRVGRLLPGGKRPGGLKAGGPSCTAFIIDTPDDPNTDKLHLTAGHCFDRVDQDGNPLNLEWDQNLPDPYVLQFNVPKSQPNCTIVHPSVHDQFPVNRDRVISANHGEGNDWAVFRCHRQRDESGVARTTFERQGDAFDAFNPSPAIPEGDLPVLMIGYGVDGANTVNAHIGPDGLQHPAHKDDCGNPIYSSHCDSGTADAVLNGVQQTAKGTVSLRSDLKTVYGMPVVLSGRIDSCAANSGSPIATWELDPLDQQVVVRVIGIYTHGGCDGNPQSKENSGTAVTHPLLQQAIQHEKPEKKPPSIGGACEPIALGVEFQQKLWQQWWCIPDDLTVQFDRIDITIGKVTQAFKLDPNSPPVFVCKSNPSDPGSKAVGVFKEHKKDVNPAKSIEITAFRRGGAIPPPNHNPWTKGIIQQHLDHANQIWNNEAERIWNWNGVNINLAPFQNNPGYEPDLEIPKTDNYYPNDAYREGDTNAIALKALCNTALAQAGYKPGSLPVIFIRNFVDVDQNQNKTKNSKLLGVTLTAAGTCIAPPASVGMLCGKNTDCDSVLGGDGVCNTKKPGRCVVMSYQAHQSSDDPPIPNPKPGHVLAHEFGHVLCLDHPAEHNALHPGDIPIPWEDNLMFPTKVPGGGQNLTVLQVQQAQTCPHTFSQDIKYAVSHEIWSAEFGYPKQCIGSVDVYLQPLDPTDHPVIKDVLFSHIHECSVICKNGTEAADKAADEPGCHNYCDQVCGSNDAVFSCVYQGNNIKGNCDVECKEEPGVIQHLGAVGDTEQCKFLCEEHCLLKDSEILSCFFKDENIKGNCEVVCLDGSSQHFLLTDPQAETCHEVCDGFCGGNPNVFSCSFKGENIKSRGACCDNDPFGTCTDGVLEPDCVCKKCKWFEKQRCDEVVCMHGSIPTVSEWGMVVLTLLLLTGAKIWYGRRRQAAISG